jgi:hypothetical protein
MNKTTATETTTKTATFRFRELRRANDLFGKVDYLVTETLTARDGGVEVRATAFGVCDGDRVNTSETKFHAGVDFERACDYRRRHGYSEVQR